MSPYQTYLNVLVFLAIGLGFAAVNTVIPFLISPPSRGARRADPYESGEKPVGAAWIRFDIYYYLAGLLFVAFDVEAVLLFPVLLAYGEVPGILPFFEVTTFLLILTAALVFAWKKGYLSWK